MPNLREHQVGSPAVAKSEMPPLSPDAAAVGEGKVFSTLQEASWGTAGDVQWAQLTMIYNYKFFS